MHEGVYVRIFFWQNDGSENLDNFSRIRCLYMRRWCLHGRINSYNSFWWSNLILCLYNVDTLNICMKEFGSEKKIDKMTAVRTETIYQTWFSIEGLRLTPWVDLGVKRSKFNFLYTHKLCLWWGYCFHFVCPCVRASVCNVLFPK